MTASRHAPVVSVQRPLHSRQNDSVSRQACCGVDRLGRRADARARRSSTNGTRLARRRPRSRRRSCQSSPRIGARRAQHEASGAGDGAQAVPSSSRVTHGTRRAVVEAQRPAPCASARGPRRPTTMRTTSARARRASGMKSITRDRALGRSRSSVSSTSVSGGSGARDAAHAGSAARSASGRCSGVPSSAAKQASESKRGQHSQSIEPSRPTSAAVSAVADQRVVFNLRQESPASPAVVDMSML